MKRYISSLNCVILFLVASVLGCMGAVQAVDRQSAERECGRFLDGNEWLTPALGWQKEPRAEPVDESAIFEITRLDGVFCLLEKQPILEIDEAQASYFTVKKSETRLQQLLARAAEMEGEADKNLNAAAASASNEFKKIITARAYAQRESAKKMRERANSVRPFLVRAVTAHAGTGSISMAFNGKTLSVSYGALADGAMELHKTAYVVYLPKKPERVTIYASVAQ
jgi:hypothetical protein